MDNGSREHLRDKEAKKMKELVLKGKQNFMGKEIPVVYGGFGEGKKCISDKTIAEIYEMKKFYVI